jgi:hypothetical protein
VIAEKQERRESLPTAHWLAGLQFIRINKALVTVGEREKGQVGKRDIHQTQKKEIGKS